MTDRGTVRFGDGTQVPSLGQGTWMMGERSSERDNEVEALRAGLDHGLRVIDTAEIYGDGGSEEVVARAISGRRDEVFLVSKVAPSHASRTGTREACEASLRRLATDHLDLYLLHWRGRHPLAETVAGLTDLVEAGRIRRWGVSNFDVADMEELWRVPGGDACAANQILYNLESRGPEFDLLPWLDQHGVVPMAYSPLGQGGDLLSHAALGEVAARRGVTPAQVALAFTLVRPNVLSIPKASTRRHVDENAAAQGLVLDSEDRAVLDRAFPAPTRKRPLEMI
jgi:diketogulonate reductase-like aldo/keto reductase